MFRQKPDPIMVNIEEFNNLNGGEKLITEIDINELDWYELSGKKLSDAFIRKYAKYIEWDNFFNNKENKLALDFVKESFRTPSIGLDADLVLIHQKMPLEFLKQHLNMFDLEYLPFYEDYGFEIYEEHIEELDWWAYSALEKLTPEFMIKFKEHIVWDEACKKQKFTPELLEELKDYVDWDTIKNRYTHSEEIQELVKKYI